MPRLEGKVVWITGASSGLGMELARQLSARGNRLILSARRREPMEGLGIDGAVIAPCDVADRDAVRRAHAEGVARLGPVEVLICNAGIGENSTAARFDAAGVKRIMDVSYLGTVYPLECVLPEMMRRRAGVIAGISSLGGWRGFAGHGAYAAAKGAVRLLLESLRCDLKRSGVQVSVICPGFIRTPMTDRNPYAMPQLQPVDAAARKIIAAIERGAREFAFPAPFAWVVRSFYYMPNFIFDRLNVHSLKRQKRPEA
jgi:NAD(P)-dependent dehydrogenase (short-subunit alcohol dehydrogenase family)